MDVLNWVKIGLDVAKALDTGKESNQHLMSQPPPRARSPYSSRDPNFGIRTALLLRELREQAREPLVEIG